MFKDLKTISNCFKLKASKKATKQKVLVPKAHDRIALVHELVKALNIYANVGVEHQYNFSRNSNS